MTTEGKTERTAKEDPTKPGHVCPYHAERILPERYEVPNAKWLCGECGWLCDMCKEERADARTDGLVEGLRRAVLRELIRSNAKGVAAALRQREGGEGS